MRVAFTPPCTFSNDQSCHLATHAIVFDKGCIKFLPSPLGWGKEIKDPRGGEGKREGKGKEKEKVKKGK